MKKVSFIIAGLVSLMLVGCGSDGGENSSASSIENSSAPSIEVANYPAIPQIPND